MQADAIANQLDRIADIQMVMAIATSILALFALALAAAALFAVIKVRKALERGLDQLPAKLDPMISATTRVAENAREVSDTVKVRVKDFMQNLDDISDRLKTGADAVEHRIRRFGVVMDVVQSEAEELLLDAASTAHGVHTAAQRLRAGNTEDELDEEDFEDLDFDYDEDS